MDNQKIINLSNTIVNYSLEIKEGDNVQIDFTHNARDLVKELIKQIKEKKANVFLRMTDTILNADAAISSTNKRIDTIKKTRELEVELMDVYIHIRETENDYETKNVEPEILKEFGKALKKVSDIRVNERRWVLIDYPTKLDAYKNKMTSDEFREFAFDVMTVDYKKMSNDVKPLVNLMNNTDKVKITGPGTDISFSIKGIGSVPCVGERNIPDGECYSAPVKTSVNGVITYNVASPYQGDIYHNVSLTFKDGKIVNATSDNDDKRLNEIFDTDEGARYIGEFALGFNPRITKPMGNILYDEKILGSLHFTPGKCYRDADNGNESSIHWDMVLIQTKKFGGGEIYFDDVLIRKDGMFIQEELKHLNG